MESIKISVEVSVNLSESTQDFIKSLFVATAPKAAVLVGAELKAAEPTVTAASVEAKPEAKPTAPATLVEAKPEAKPAAPATPVEAKPEAKPVVEPTAPAVSIEDVRQELVKKVNAHREEIKAKLTEFGAPSVTKLDPSKYADMYNFLTSL